MKSEITVFLEYMKKIKVLYSKLEFSLWGLRWPSGAADAAAAALLAGDMSSAGYAGRLLGSSWEAPPGTAAFLDWVSRSSYISLLKFVFKMRFFSREARGPSGGLRGGLPEQLHFFT